MVLSIPSIPSIPSLPVPFTTNLSPPALFTTSILYRRHSSPLAYTQHPSPSTASFTTLLYRYLAIPRSLNCTLLIDAIPVLLPPYTRHLSPPASFTTSTLYHWHPSPLVLFTTSTLYHRHPSPAAPFTTGTLHHWHALSTLHSSLLASPLYSTGI